MKTHLTAVLLCLFLMAQLHAQTNVSGSIVSNATWTKANSPYIVTGNIAVFAGVSLTIEPGVEVRFNSSTQIEFRDNASLYANGTITDSITFTSNQSNPQMNDWLGLDLQLIDVFEFSYARLEYAETGIEGQGLSYPTSNIKIEHSRFYRNKVALDIVYHRFISVCSFIENRVGITEVGEGSVISDCSFIQNYEGIQGSGASNPSTVRSSDFCGNHIGMSGVDSVIVCTIVNNDTGIAGQRNAYWLDNVIAFNHLGFEAGLKNGDVLQGSFVFKNNVGGAFTFVSGGYQFTDFTICENTLYDAIAVNSFKFNLSGICWCSTDSSVIANKIYDGYDNVSLGLINFMPFTSCNSSALPSDPDTNCNDIGTDIEHIGIQETSNLIYPNPASNQVTLVFEQKGKGLVQIFRNDGVLVYRIQVNDSMRQLKIDVSGIPDGLYILKVVQNDGGTSMNKLIVSH
ncbi:MAG TPA: hypothetical protein DCX54_09800 [Flavobacteriales bacterium]|nr:hypothetical protein [Flavobacteriales bacterium]